MAGVGTERVFEDDRVVVWRLDLEPGEQGERHTHQRDFVVRVLAGSTLEVRGPRDEVLYTVDRQPGEALAFRVEDGQVISSHRDGRAVPATHSVRNVGEQTFREVLIEFKDP